MESRADVSGVVVDDLGQPFPNVALSIAGRRATSDASGHFKLTDVRLPYDVKALVGTDRLAVFMGMTKLDPTLRIGEATAPGTHVAQLRMVGAEQIDATHGFGILVETPGRAQGTVSVGGIGNDPDARTYRFTWPAGSPLKVHARAFRYDRDEKTAAPSHFTSMAEFEGTLSADMEWTPTWLPYKGGETQVVVDNTTLVPPLNNTSLAVQTDTSALPLLMSAGDARGSIQFTVPTIEGATLFAANSHEEASISQFALAGPKALTDTTLKLEAQMSFDRLTANPTDHGAAKNLTFNWHGYGNAGFLRLDSDRVGRPFGIIMFDGSIEDLKLPDLSEFGLAWPKGATYSWNLVTTREQSIEDVAQKGVNGVLPAGWGEARKFTFE